jgi:hypothetical protein
MEIESFRIINAKDINVDDYISTMDSTQPSKVVEIEETDEIPQFGNLIIKIDIGNEKPFHITCRPEQNFKRYIIQNEQE